MGFFSSTACVTFLCIFAIGLSPGQGTLAGSQKQPDRLECENRSYISSGNSCCNGNITEGLSQLVSHCCDSVAYNHLNEICCKGIVLIRTSAHVKCCGKDQYLPKTHLCCGDNITVRTETHDCCGGKLYDKTTNICCNFDNPSGPILRPKTESCSKNQIADSRQKTNKCQEGSSLTLTSPCCGSESYDPKKQICCSGTPYKASAHTQCCGKYIYTPFDDHVLCCNGTLHRDLPKHSECVGGVVYTPGNSTCHLSARPRLGEHCCGEKAFNPDTHICCNGHSHNKSNGTFCCGSEVYDHHKQVCCSGRRFDKSSGECCGNLLLKRNSAKICCSSSTHAMIYDSKPNHHCCGHYYYNMSLWSCCAEHLKPTPSHKISAGHMLKPMMDLIPDLCNKTVLFGKVESMTLYADKRYIVLKVGNVGKEPWLHISLDHCSSPALETGMTYLWERINNEYKPLSISVDIISDMHMLYTVCDKLKCQKGG